MAKRLFDVMLATVGLVLLSLPLALIYLCVRIDSPGPGLYFQERVGRNGITFRMLKFRTMWRDTPPGASLTVGCDPRVTRVGRMLRKYKLDELPQLFNVIRGEMSLVGPRPEVPEYAFLLPEQKEVWSVRPGITDVASIRFRNESALLARAEDPDAFYRSSVLPAKTGLYLEYVRKHSVLGDIGIICATIALVASAPTSTAQVAIEEDIEQVA